MDYAVVLASVFAVHVLAMISPGPNVLIVTQSAISQSRKAGIATAIGIAAGAAFWSSAAILGLSVLFARFTWIYRGLEVLGGIYLIYLGIRLWRTAFAPLPTATGARVPSRTYGQAFRDGLLTNLTNPKSIIFYGSIFAALLPPDLPVWVKAAAFCIIVVNSTAWHIALACLFSVRRAQHAYERSKRWIDRIAGATLAFLGIRLLLGNR